MVILIEALKGGMAELRDCPDFSTRLSTAARHARLIAEELTGQVFLVPFALRALSERSKARKEGRLLEGLRYGPRERQVADLWLPVEAERSNREEEKGRRPPAVAVLFHGGTWTAGDKWHIGPAASHLSSKCGCVVVVPNYSVYDSRGGLGISAAVEDAVDAVKWAGTAAGEGKAGGRETSWPTTSSSPSSSFPCSHGGDPTRLAVLGHSAGAHLAVAAAMVLAAERERDEEEEEEGKGKERKRKPFSLPSAVVSLAGPFDLPSHFEHEAKRGVHRLSTMARAAATPASFAMEAVERSREGQEKERSGKEKRRSSSSSSSLFFDTAPEDHRASLIALSPLAALDPEASLAGVRPAVGPLAGVAEAEAAKRGPRGGNQKKKQDHQPRFLFISSAADVVVPSSSSAALHSALVKRNRDSTHVEYSLEQGVGHADFVVRSWGGDGNGSGSGEGEGGSGGGGGGGSGGAPPPWAAKVEAVVSSL